MQPSPVSVLQEYFGHTAFKEGQQELISALLSGRDAVGVMPTGSGKSMCYQIPALMLPGVTVVVSPLISLMKDQVTALIQSGVRAAYINTSLTSEQMARALQNAKQGMYKIIYVAPERLCTPGFLSLSRYVQVSLLAVDEAHCVSQWGQDFRPSYLSIPEYLETLPYRPIVGAFTATATEQVKQDIVKLLGLRDPYCLTTGFDRQNLYFGVLSPRDKYAETLRLVRENQGGSGIIYCTSRRAVEEVCERLCEDGISCTRYHAGLSDEERRQNQEDFINDRCEVITATNAFGMGIDKSNVSYVIHYNMPRNIENYYQEAGRAGRDGSEAKCILLYSPRDEQTARYLIDQSGQELEGEEHEAYQRRELEKLRVMCGYCLTDLCLREYILRYFGDLRPCTCGNCSNCTGEQELQDVTIEAQKILSCVYRLHRRNLHFGSGMVANILRGDKNEKIEKFHLETLSTYGIMKDCTNTYIRSIIRRLASQGYLTQGEHRTLTLTYRAADVLMKGERVRMKVPASRTRDPADRYLKRSIRKSIERGAALGIDTELLERLKAVRLRLAKARGIAPFIVFTDATLRDMCVKLPTNLEEMGEVSGVGRKKLTTYGAAFTDEIRAYLVENPHAGPRQADVIEGESLIRTAARRRGELHTSEVEFTLAGFCDEILSQLGIHADRHELFDPIQDWLLKENYLQRVIVQGKAELHTTILSPEAGILEVMKISQGGKEYRSLAYPPAAQQFIIDNLADIAR